MEVIIDKTFDQDNAENCYMKSNVTLTKTQYSDKLILEI